MPIHVRIIGDHPHAGRTGQLVEIQKFKHGLPDMGKVVFDDHRHDGEVYGEACYAQSKNLVQIEENHDCDKSNRRTQRT